MKTSLFLLFIAINVSAFSQDKTVLGIDFSLKEMPVTNKITRNYKTFFRTDAYRFSSNVTKRQVNDSKFDTEIELAKINNAGEVVTSQIVFKKNLLFIWNKPSISYYDGNIVILFAYVEYEKFKTRDHVLYRILVDAETLQIKSEEEFYRSKHSSNGNTFIKSKIANSGPNHQDKVVTWFDPMKSEVRMFLFNKDGELENDVVHVAKSGYDRVVYKDFAITQNHFIHFIQYANKKEKRYAASVYTYDRMAKESTTCDLTISDEGVRLDSPALALKKDGNLLMVGRYATYSDKTPTEGGYIALTINPSSGESQHTSKEVTKTTKKDLKSYDKLLDRGSLRPFALTLMENGSSASIHYTYFSRTSGDRVLYYNGTNTIIIVDAEGNIKKVEFDNRLSECDYDSDDPNFIHFSNENEVKIIYTTKKSLSVVSINPDEGSVQKEMVYDLDLNGKQKIECDLLRAQKRLGESGEISYYDRIEYHKMDKQIFINLSK